MTDISTSSQILEKWIQLENYLGHDPFDALNSPLVKRLTFGNKKVAQAWVQIIKRSPINFRSLIRIQKAYNPKGMGIFLSTYAKRYIAFGKSEDLEHAGFFANWLLEHRSPGYHGNCWGYNFDWSNRNFFAPAGTPTVVNTGFIGLAFLDYAEALRKADCSDETAIQTTVSACAFILHDLHNYETEDELSFSYTPLDHLYIHNANLLGAWLLSAIYTQTNNSEYADMSLKSARFSVRRIEPDGSWKYGLDSKNAWVDNFHTGYVLVALKQISKNLRINEFQSQISQGYKFWKEKFFLSSGAPKYYSNSVYPIDSHSISQAILTFLDYSDVDNEALDWACKIAEWGCKSMQDPEGFFYYQKHRFFTNKIPYMRWSEAWMFQALTDLQIKQTREVSRVQV